MCSRTGHGGSGPKGGIQGALRDEEILVIRRGNWAQAQAVVPGSATTEGRYCGYDFVRGTRVWEELSQFGQEYIRSRAPRVGERFNYSSPDWKTSQAVILPF